MKAVNVVKAAVWIAFLTAISTAGIKYVAVVETGIDERSGAAADITSAEVALITAELRREAVNNLPRDKYSVMTSETVQSMGGAVLEECSEENCVITLGSRIGADFMVRGVISKFQTMLTLSVEMYETENGTLVASSDPVRSERPTELLSMAAEASANMYRKFAGGGETGRKKETRKADKKQAEKSYTVTMSAEEMNKVAVSANKNETVTMIYDKSTGMWHEKFMYYDKSTGEWYEDFTTGQRWRTFALNLLPGGLGSFLIMKDKVGGKVLLVANGVGYVGVFGTALILDAAHVPPSDGIVIPLGAVAVVSFYGAGIFNIYRSYTYHKPKPNAAAAAANSFKPYDGLKLAVFPTASGDFKVFARYDYSF